MASVDYLLQLTCDLLSEGKALGLVDIRIFGGLGIRSHCPVTRDLFPCRPDLDIDLIAPTTLDVLQFQALASRFGFVRRAYSAYEGGTVYEYRGEGGHHGEPILHLFVGNFLFSHFLSYTHRLFSDWPTLPLAELLLTKLQIHEAEKKDREDVLMLVTEHALGESDADEIDLQKLLATCCNDWGLWYNCFGNLDAITAMLKDASYLPEREQRTAQTRLADLKRALKESPKTLRWRMRAALAWLGWTKCWNDVEDWR